MILSYSFGGWEVHYPGAHVCAVPRLKAGQTRRHMFEGTGFRLVQPPARHSWSTVLPEQPQSLHLWLTFACLEIALTR